MDLQQAIKEVTDLLKKFALHGTDVSIETWGDDRPNIGIRVAEVSWKLRDSPGVSTVMQDDMPSGPYCYWVERSIVYRLLAASGGIPAKDVWDADWRMIYNIYGSARADEFEKEH